MKIFSSDKDIAVVYSRAELFFEDSGLKKIFPKKSKLKDGVLITNTAFSLKIEINKHFKESQVINSSNNSHL